MILLNFLPFFWKNIGVLKTRETSFEMKKKKLKKIMYLTKKKKKRLGEIPQEKARKWISLEGGKIEY